MQIGFAVERLAGLENPAQIFHGPIASGHGAKISLGDDARHVFLGLRFYPDGVAVGKEIVIVLFFRDDAAADGKYDAVVFREHSLQRTLLNGTKARLPVE